MYITHDKTIFVGMTKPKEAQNLAEPAQLIHKSQ